MVVPDLSRIVETHVPVASLEYRAYLDQLLVDVLPHIRRLQSAQQLRWFSFLLHPASQVGGCDQADCRPVLHLRLEPADDLDVARFIQVLPPHFLNPHAVVLGPFSGVDGTILRDGDWAQGWRVVGESAEWALCLLEAHAGKLPPQQTTQFLHYITNVLLLGGQCAYVPGMQVF